MFSGPVEQDVGDDLGATILPAQYYPKRQKLLEGEYRLLVAVLEEAVRCYLASRDAGTSQQRMAFDEVRRWFFASGMAAPTGLFTFESICELLEIDAEVLRGRLSSISIRALPTHRRPRSHSLVSGLRRARRQPTAPHGPAAPALRAEPLRSNFERP